MTQNLQLNWKTKYLVQLLTFSHLTAEVMVCKDHGPEKVAQQGRYQELDIPPELTMTRRELFREAAERLWGKKTNIQDS